MNTSPPVTRKDLVKLAKKVDAYNKPTLGVAPSKATKKELRKGIVRKIVIAGSLGGAIALAGGYYYTKKQRTSPKAKRVVSLQEKEEVTKVPEQLKDAVKPTKAETKNVNKKLKDDQKLLKNICQSIYDKGGIMTKNQKEIVIKLAREYGLFVHGKPANMLKVIGVFKKHEEKACEMVKIGETTGYSDKIIYALRRVLDRVPEE